MNYIAKRIRWIGFLLLLGFSAAAVGLYFDTPDATKTKVAPKNLPPLYVCPMHSEVTSTHPDKCPKCLMALVPASEAGQAESGCGALDDGCCATTPQVELTLPPGHPSIPGYKTHSN